MTVHLFGHPASPGLEGVARRHGLALVEDAAAATPMGQFLTLYLVEQVHVSNSGTQNILLVAPMVAQLGQVPQ